MTSALENLSWEFPYAEMSQYLGEHMLLIMPLLILIVGVLLALLVVDGVMDVFLKIARFVVEVQPSATDASMQLGSNKTDLSSDDSMLDSSQRFDLGDDWFDDEPIELSDFRRRRFSRSLDDD